MALQVADETMTALQGRVALVTGAGSGIGRAIAVAVASHGASVFLVSRKLPSLELVAQTIRELPEPPRAWISSADLRNLKDIERIKTQVENESGSLDILVHSAGLYSRGAMSQLSSDEFDELYEANVRAPFLLTNSLLPALRSNNGQIVFINSSTGISARAGVGPFSSTQHALRGIANAFREELNLDGIRVLNMFLGRTATPRIEALYSRDARPYRPELLMQPEDVAAMVVNALKLPRTAEVTEIHMRPLLKSY